MSDPNLLTIDEDTDNVEPVLIARLAMPVDPDVRRSGQLLLLSPVNGGDRATKVGAFSRLDLDECHRPILLDYQVDIPTTVSKATVHDSPTALPEPPLRDTLAQLPECLLGRGHGAILQAFLVGASPKKRGLDQFAAEP